MWKDQPQPPSSLCPSSPVSPTSATSALASANSRSSAILASISEPDAETTLRKVTAPTIAAASATLAAPTTTRAAGNRPRRRPPSAPQAANRGSDNSSNLPRRPAIPCTVEKTKPPRKAGYASAASQISTSDPSGFGQTLWITSYTAPDERPSGRPGQAHSERGADARLSRFFIAASRCTPWTRASLGGKRQTLLPGRWRSRATSMRRTRDIRRRLPK